MILVMVTWPFSNFAVCRDAARRAGLSATADPCWFRHTHNTHTHPGSCPGFMLANWAS